ncbi:uncharacterized protein LOC130965573 [Arachis stenosperma]|uniref:uncharacterized protein LOC130965573 n=1 Tax=Arachis stenosperma TaxID=217475 RepID=UPI0025ABFCDC|nr:uncharacterized protein LOC130965573 [Arachis stenosperma]
MTTFVDIIRAFLAQFTMPIAKVKYPINLLGVTQRSEKPTKKYLDRFNDECLEIDGLTDSVASLCLTNGLLNEDFKEHLTTKSMWTMQEIQNVAREYINDEEVNQVVAANKQQPPIILLVSPVTEKGLRSTPWTERQLKPSSPPIVGVYQQIADKDILSKPQQLKDRTGGNKNLYCDYHKGFDHKTQDCFDLKDAPEQAIREADITRAFLAQFTTRIAKAKHPINLLGVTQISGEPTRKYLDRFNDEYLEIDDLNNSIARLCLTNGVAERRFQEAPYHQARVDDARNPKCG